MRIVSLKSDELFHKVNLNVLLYMYVKLEYCTRNIDIKSKFKCIVVYVCETKLEYTEHKHKAYLYVISYTKLRYKDCIYFEMRMFITWQTYVSSVKDF